MQNCAHSIDAPRYGEPLRCEKQPLDNGIGKTENERREYGAHCQSSFIPALLRIEQTLQPRNQTPEQRDGMPPRLRIAKDHIETERTHRDQCRTHHASAPMPTIARSFSISRLLRTVSARRS